MLYCLILKITFVVYRYLLTLFINLFAKSNKNKTKIILLNKDYSKNRIIKDSE